VEKKNIGITMGDPAGIGPEIIVKALLNQEIHEICNPIVIGDLKLLQYTAKKMKKNLKLQPIIHLKNSLKLEDKIGIVDLQNINVNELQIGKVSKDSGKASIEYLKRAVNYAMNGELDALVTAPINKKSINLAGCDYIGHTELIGSITKTDDPITMFWVRGVRIFFLTRHLPLSEAIKRITKDRILQFCIRIDDFLKKMRLINPHIAIAALNPHASDDGLVGVEEKSIIQPAIAELQRRNINVSGPIPADSIFFQAFLGKYDAVLSLYHDQGHIAAKTFDFYGTVSVTLGLPFIRTSVDHGTAFNIAGKGIADSRSLEEAIKVAVQLVSII
jgi:4-hydroxythreonine-4-phosphate dehydrogenase